MSTSTTDICYTTLYEEFRSGSFVLTGWTRPKLRPRGSIVIVKLHMDHLQSGETLLQGSDDVRFTVSPLVLSLKTKNSSL